jgi:hypothetical protein
MRKDEEMDRQTDMAELIVEFRNFANPPNNNLETWRG